MASCEDLFQRKLALDLEKQANDEDLSNIRRIQASRIPSDDEFRKAQKIAEDPEVQDASRKTVDENVAQQKAGDEKRMLDGKSGVPDPAVNIGEGQSVNYRQKLRNNPEDVARQYAELDVTLRKAGSEAMPEDFAMKGYANPKKQAALMQTLAERGSVPEWQRTLASAGDRVTGLIDDVVTVRYMHDTAKEAYGFGALEQMEWIKANPGKPISPEAKTKLFNQFKVALMAQRHYDYIRGAWGRIGQALQGQGFRGSLVDFVDEDVVRAVDEAQEMIENAGQAPTILEAGKITVEDVSLDTSFGRMLEAFDKAQTNPKEAMEQLQLEVRNVQIKGVDPRMEDATKGAGYNRMKSFNLLTKDWQLFNERTNSLNGGSNVTMALYGPYRQFYEDWQEYFEPVGTSLTAAGIKAWRTNWEGVGASVAAIRDAGKEVFMDALVDGKAMYANNPDTYAKLNDNIDEMVAELEDVARGGIGNGRPMAWNAELPRRIASQMNPERYGRWFHANARLWMFEKTGKSWFLRPGLRTMGAVDNVAGFGAAVYKIRHDLEMKYRMGGTQLQMEDSFKALSPEEQRAKVNDQIMEEFKAAFYSEQPTEAQRISYRTETGKKPEFVSDQQIDDLIMEERVGKKYGGMVANAQTRAASDFAEEMRFANRPGRPGGRIRDIYDGIDKVRRDPMVEAAMPYFRAPFLGTGFDFDHLGWAPAIKEVFMKPGMTPKEIRRNRATLAMAGHVYAVWGTMSAAGLLTGNGPAVTPGDPESAKRRQQWLLEMQGQGRKPNSLGPISMPGGFPLINTLFLMEDLKDNLMEAASSKFDQLSLAEATLGVLMGHLSRSSAIGQVQTLMEVAYGNPYQQDRFGAFAGYMAAGRYLPSGPMRGIERFTNSSQSNLYRDEAWTEEDFLKLDAEGQAQMQTWERRLRNAAYNVTGLAGVFGGKYRDKSWYGEKIRLPWGYDIKRYLDNRFDPVIHDNNKIAGELRRLNLLTRPEELVSRRLLDVPMTDDMQKYWNDTYGELKGTTDPSLITKTPISVKVPFLKMQTAEGIKYNAEADLFNIDLSLFLGKFTNGKTFIEAARALSQSEMYQNMEAADPTSYGKDAPKGEKRQAPAYKMMYALKRYYAEMTTAKMRNMENPPDFVARWREQATLMGTNLTAEYAESAGAKEALEEGEARVKALTDALSRPQ